ncbi:E3 ubiquitin-protein ligase SDIR1-like [Papaver somniferum]|uniref:E3 ubiquitin-protein ligase SDIR1-like n=1 Tax=Papaver somniferum TaxID=3469 RepID=UPI000E6F6047|nr:E3 ubiquitin-protein ligase SDIR1-like [Papaver somniferum]
MVDGDLDARLRQMEADEILARQLQEQLYDEMPGVGFGENDASLVWRLQQQEQPQHLSIGGQHRSTPRDSSMSHLYRQYTSQSFVDNSVLPANRHCSSLYMRTARLRNNHQRPQMVSSSRGRQTQFPSTVDIHSRMRILEALEALSERGTMTMASHFLQIQRDFNENDYEMLLALDDNNHQHVGASVNQINGLPQSTVQTASFEEACVICLETPTIGDAIRHLPCLHKFHKDCIDQWLRRSTSCPVCKSGINSEGSVS